MKRTGVQRCFLRSAGFRGISYFQSRSKVYLSLPLFRAISPPPFISISDLSLVAVANGFPDYIQRVGQKFLPIYLKKKELKYKNFFKYLFIIRVAFCVFQFIKKNKLKKVNNNNIYSIVNNNNINNNNIYSNNIV